MINKKTIIIDMDNSFFPLIELCIPKYNEKYNDTLKFESINDYDIKKFIKPEVNNFFKEFATKDIFENGKPYDGSVEIISELNEKYDLCILTSAHPNTMEHRDKWLEKHFKFYSSSQLIMCRNKGRVIGDLLIDDYVENLKAWKTKGIVFNQLWNEYFGNNRYNMPRIFKWDEKVIDIIEELLNKM